MLCIAQIVGIVIGHPFGHLSVRVGCIPGQSDWAFSGQSGCIARLKFEQDGGTTEKCGAEAAIRAAGPLLEKGNWRLKDEMGRFSSKLAPYRGTFLPFGGDVSNGGSLQQQLSIAPTDFQRTT